MRPLVVILFIISFTKVTFSQEKKAGENTIESQFEEIFSTSTSYKTFKVIDRDKYLKLKKSVLDSLKKSKKVLYEKEILLKSEIENISLLNDSLSKTKNDLKNLKLKENSISLFGGQLSKTSYSFILWTIIIGLASGLGFFVFKFLKSNILTKEAQENLITVEDEFTIYRKKSIEREQKLRRQLQDEINKHRNA